MDMEGVPRKRPGGENLKFGKGAILPKEMLEKIFGSIPPVVKESQPGAINQEEKKGLTETAETAVSYLLSELQKRNPALAKFMIDRLLNERKLAAKINHLSQDEARKLEITALLTMAQIIYEKNIGPEFYELSK